MFHNGRQVSLFSLTHLFFELNDLSGTSLERLLFRQDEHCDCTADKIQIVSR